MKSEGLRRAEDIAATSLGITKPHWDIAAIRLGLDTRRADQAFLTVAGIANGRRSVFRAAMLACALVLVNEANSRGADYGTGQALLHVAVGLAAGIAALVIWGRVVDHCLLAMHRRGEGSLFGIRAMSFLGTCCNVVFFSLIVYWVILERSIVTLIILVAPEVPLSLWFMLSSGVSAVLGMERVAWLYCTGRFLLPLQEKYQSMIRWPLLKAYLILRLYASAYSSPYAHATLRGLSDPELFVDIFDDAAFIGRASSESQEEKEEES